MLTPDTETVSWLRVLLACVTLLGLLAAFGFALKFLSQKGWFTPRASSQRLSVSALLPLDARHRIVIAKCDQKEYILLLGPTGDILLDQRQLSDPPSSQTG